MANVLLTGGTGYVGGRLAPRLIEAGHEVTALVRDVARASRQTWAQGVELIEGDLLEPATLSAAFAGADVAFYLVHSMVGRADFAEVDRRAAEHFAKAAAHAGVQRVIYLGGLQHHDQQGRELKVSKHLASRAEVGRVLAQHVPVLEFRAGPIVGSGSASFEMVRYLTERLPVMITPRWVKTEVQTIAIGDILAYLLAAVNLEPNDLTQSGVDDHGHVVVDVGADRLRFVDLMHRYADERGLSRRWILPTPVLAPKLASRWVGFVTPISNSLAGPLVMGMVKPVVADTTLAEALFPRVKPRTYREAVAKALRRTGANRVETRWTGTAGDTTAGSELRDEQGLIREVRRRRIDAPCDAVFAAFSSLGGEKGWLAWNWAWKLRGLVDQILGGPGLRRGRRHPTQLALGEAVDWWRVDVVDPPKLLRLRAEMKVPGKAWLQFEADDCTDEQGVGTMLSQSALFEPKGLPGWIYWYALLPIHIWIFSDMSKAVAAEAERLANHHGDASLAGAAS